MLPNKWLTIGTRSLSLWQQGSVLFAGVTSFLLMAGLGVAGLFNWLDGETVARNRDRFLAMDTSAKNELLRKWEQFQTLSPEQQQQYREFHQQLNGQPDAEQLKVVLDRYANWILTVPQTLRAEINQADVARKVALIQKERIDQNLRTAGLDAKTRLSVNDAEALREWLQSLQERRPPYQPEELDRLQMSLSPEPRELMQQFATGNIGLPDSDGSQLGDVRSRLVENWLMSILWRIPPNDQQLQQTYENLSEKQREALVELEGDPERIRRAMIGFYYEQMGLDRRRMRRSGPSSRNSDD